MFSQVSVSHSVHGGGVLTLRIHGPGILRETVDKRIVRILLECFLVIYKRIN